MKKIALDFDPKEGLYRTFIKLDRQFFVELKEKNFLEHIFSFEDIPENFNAEIQILTIEEWEKEFVDVFVYTDVNIPKKWKKDQLKTNLNRDLMGIDLKVIECCFRLEREHVHVNLDCSKIEIEIPIGYNKILL